MSDQPRAFRAADVPDPSGAEPPPTSRPTEPPAPPERAPTARDLPAPAEEAAYDPRELGANLSSAMELGQYHPVLLFGTAASGKTSLLLSLFGTIETELKLQASLSLCNPLLGQGRLAEQLHQEAKHTFDIKKRLFIQGRAPQRTNVALPFFIPVELCPAGDKPAQKLAFLESNGEWYRGLEDEALATAGLGTEVHARLRGEIEHFIASFRGPITFVYLAPNTQAKIARDTNTNADARELKMASRAIQGLVDAYKQYRVDFREGDWHQLLVTKWDVAGGRDGDPEDRAEDDDEAVSAFLETHYGEALGALRSLRTDRLRRKPYTAGIMNEHGVLQLARESDLRGTIQAYPENLWRRLYQNALVAHGDPPRSPFPDPPARPALLRVFDRMLRFVSGD